MCTLVEEVSYVNYTLEMDRYCRLLIFVVHCRWYSKTFIVVFMCLCQTKSTLPDKVYFTSFCCLTGSDYQFLLANMTNTLVKPFHLVPVLIFSQ